MQEGWRPVRIPAGPFTTATAPWRRAQAREDAGWRMQAEEERAMSGMCLPIRTGFVVSGDSAGSSFTPTAYSPAFTIHWRCRMDSSHFMFSTNAGL